MTKNLSEKYRPTTFDEIVGQDVAVIETVLEKGRRPNFLFYGPPGTGKTSVAYCIAYKLHGNDHNLIETNSSDSRGIDDIREIVEKSRYVMNPNKPTIFLLDEADRLTREAQEALRRPLENSPAMFILTGNDFTGFTDAIKDRCFVGGVEFSSVSVPKITERLSYIADKEGLDIDESRLETLAKQSNGSVRRAISLLEKESVENQINQSEELEHVKQLLEQE